jgi:predicted nucleic acid-binding protein
VTFLADVNVLIDLAVDRQPRAADAKRLFDAAAARGLTVYVAATTLPTLFYLVKRLVDEPTALAAVDRTRAGSEIAPVTRSTILAARGMPGRDFEDNIQIACAVEAGVDLIVTRDPADFAHSPVTAISPSALLATFP